MAHLQPGWLSISPLLSPPLKGQFVAAAAAAAPTVSLIWIQSRLIMCAAEQRGRRRRRLLRPSGRIIAAAGSGAMIQLKVTTPAAAQSARPAALGRAQWARIEFGAKMPPPILLSGNTFSLRPLVARARFSSARLALGPLWFARESRIRGGPANANLGIGSLARLDKHRPGGLCCRRRGRRWRSCWALVCSAGGRFGFQAPPLHSKPETERRQLDTRRLSVSISISVSGPTGR